MINGRNLNLMAGRHSTDKIVFEAFFCVIKLKQVFVRNILMYLEKEWKMMNDEKTFINLSCQTDEPASYAGDNKIISNL